MKAAKDVSSALSNTAI
ncbi:MAG: hypothetical protein LBP23_08250 [Treponema sp.]|nr:hypothetical protein [Treponema sp.]